MAVGNPATSVLTKALWAMVIFFTLGLVLGYLASLLFDEHEARRKAELAQILERETALDEPEPEAVSEEPVSKITGAREVAA